MDRFFFTMKRSNGEWIYRIPKARGHSILTRILTTSLNKPLLSNASCKVSRTNKYLRSINSTAYILNVYLFILWNILEKDQVYWYSQPLRSSDFQKTSFFSIDIEL